MQEHYAAKILEKFSHEINCNYNSYRFSYKFTFIHFLFFLRNQKQKSASWWSLVTRNIYFFVYSESDSTSKPCRIHQTYIKEFSYKLFLFVLQFYDPKTNIIYKCSVSISNKPNYVYLPTAKRDFKKWCSLTLKRCSKLETKKMTPHTLHIFRKWSIVKRVPPCTNITKKICKKEKGNLRLNKLNKHSQLVFS